ncbi:MAG TPA: Flp family type IVb pilin [Rhizomicrobium sp.]|nr:Flp family type IVb pilin [Rhizomicrobium sp.]
MKNFARDIRGATAIEYAMVAGLIAMVVITAISAVGSNLSSSLYAAIATVP